MIINQNTNPKREIYYLGALTLEALQQGNGRVDLFDLFQRVTEKEEIAMSLFLFVLDWLFLINTIEQNNGVITLCS
jgi:hypothetical protein